MELYFKELISEEDSLEKLVDDLERVVQGVDDFARAIAVDLPEHTRSEVVRRLNRLKESCQRINFEIVSKARATDRLVRKEPYIFLGAAVLAGMIFGVTLGAKLRQ
ncbi:MAG TPA: hypothetical protein VKV04_06110 [Verrucomicrobiae bacterium]|nr:hypothetical protein [Verrucomicrobiae bacterium]